MGNIQYRGVLNPKTVPVSNVSFYHFYWRFTYSISDSRNFWWQVIQPDDCTQPIEWIEGPCVINMWTQCKYCGAFRSPWASHLPVSLLLYVWFSLLMYICRDRFNLVIGFGGNSTLLLDVIPSINKLIHLISVDQVTDPWKAIVRAMQSDGELLDITSIVVLFKGEFPAMFVFYLINNLLQRTPMDVCQGWLQAQSWESSILLKGEQDAGDKMVGKQVSAGLGPRRSETTLQHLR